MLPPACSRPIFKDAASLYNNPAKTNWIEQRGGLPGPIADLAGDLVDGGMTEGHAIATAENRAREFAVTSGPHAPKWAAAVAQLDAMRVNKGIGWTEALHPREFHGHFAAIAAADHKVLSRVANAVELRRAEVFARRNGGHEAANKLARARRYQDRHPSDVIKDHPLRQSIIRMHSRHRPSSGVPRDAVRHLGSHLFRQHHTAHVGTMATLSILGLSGSE